MLRKFARILIPTISLIILWQIGSIIRPEALPAPFRVVSLSIGFMIEGGPAPYDQSSLYHLGISLYRVFLSTSIALIISVSIGILMGFNSEFEKVVSNWIPLWLTLPDVVVILVVMVLFGFTTTSIVVAVVVGVTVFGVVNMWEGIQDLDLDLVQMAESFDASNTLRWRHIYLPHLSSYIFSSFRYIFGMVWKIVVVAEAFGVEQGIGAMFRVWYGLASVENILAYFLLFIVFILFIEYVILDQIENRVFSWAE